MRQMAVLTLAPRGLAATMDDRWGHLGGRGPNGEGGCHLHPVRQQWQLL